MKLFIFCLMVYPLWGLLVHLIFNFYLSRSLGHMRSAFSAWSAATGVNILAFTPVVFDGRDFFGPIYVPWYLAPVLSPPLADFSWTGLVTVTAVSASSSLLWRWVARRRMTSASIK